MDDWGAGYQRGLEHGFKMALYAVRNVDKQMNLPERKDFSQKDWSFEYERYNNQKDMIYKIYEEIKFEMTKELK